MSVLQSCLTGKQMLLSVCEATETAAVWRLRFGIHVCLMVLSKTVAIVTDADLLSVEHVALEWLWRTLQHICIRHSKTYFKEQLLLLVKAEDTFSGISSGMKWCFLEQQKFDFATQSWRSSPLASLAEKDNFTVLTEKNSSFWKIADWNHQPGFD